MVEPRRVGAQEPFHTRHSVSVERLHHRMKMIGHQAPGMHLPTGLGARFAQGGEKALPADSVVEDGFAPVPAI